MSKKDFSVDTDNVFSKMFSAETIEKVEKKETKLKKEENVKAKSESNNIESPKKEEKIEVKGQKIFDKKYRYSFYADPYLNEYLENITWIKRIKGLPPYLNSLIRKDFLNFLNLSEDSSEEEIGKAWNLYKKKNNI